MVVWNPYLAVTWVYRTAISEHGEILDQSYFTCSSVFSLDTIWGKTKEKNEKREGKTRWILMALKNLRFFTYRDPVFVSGLHKRLKCFFRIFSASTKMKMTIWLSNKRTQIICGADKVLLMANLWMQSSLNSMGYLHYCVSSFSLGERQKQKMFSPPPSLTLFWRKQMHSSEQLFISKHITEKPRWWAFLLEGFPYLFYKYLFTVTEYIHMARWCIKGDFSSGR